VADVGLFPSEFDLGPYFSSGAMPGTVTGFQFLKKMCISEVEYFTMTAYVKL
jgi:hypothetical protein